MNDTRLMVFDQIALNRRSRILAGIQIVQVGTGLLGQLMLLARWSPHEQTDLFLLVSSLPWLVSALFLFGGLEMALPAAYHHAVATNPASVYPLLRRIRRLGLGLSSAAALTSAAVIAFWAYSSGLEQDRSLWMGVALGSQLIPATLGSIWRGVLTAQDRVIPAQLTLLAGSIATVVGYALLRGSPAWTLPLTTLIAVTVTTGLAWRFYHHEENRPGPSRFPDSLPQTSPDLRSLIRALVALSAAAGLVHLQTLIERAALNFLETGTITALAVAGRGWDALAKVITAASVLPVFPRWADHHARADYQQNRALLRWSVRRTAALSLFAAGLIGIGAWQFGPWLADSRGWESGGQAARMVLILLPRFVLVTCIQPLVLQHYAAGTPWYPVVGSAAGIGVLAAGAAVIVPRYELPGFALVTALSVIPGWLVLGWIAWRREE